MQFDILEIYSCKYYLLLGALGYKEKYEYILYPSLQSKQSGTTIHHRRLVMLL